MPESRAALPHIPLPQWLCVSFPKTQAEGQPGRFSGQGLFLFLWFCELGQEKMHIFVSILLIEISGPSVTDMVSRTSTWLLGESRSFHDTQS